MERLTAYIEKILPYCLIILILVGVILHFVNLDADPPMYFTGDYQSLSTDPPQYTYFARNNLVFDIPPEFDNDHWQSFGNSLINGLSYLIFSLFGISRFNANLVGLILHLLSVIIFLFTLKQVLRLNAILLVTFLLLFNKALFVYSRLPYLENGMLFLLILIFLIFVKYRSMLWGQILIGVLLALAAVAGKIFGIIMVVPIVLSFIIERKPGWGKAILIAGFSSLVTFVLFSIFFFHGNLTTVIEYYQAQSLGLYGFPIALTSPLAFFERLISFGSDTRFYYHAPILGCSLFLVLLFITVRGRWSYFKNNIPVTFMLIWLAIGLLFFMIGNYRVLRYIYFLYFPMAALIGYYFCSADLDKQKTNNRWLQAIIVFLILWMFIDQLSFILFSSGKFKEIYIKLVWYSAAPASVITLINYRWPFINKFSLYRYRALLVSIVIIAGLYNFGRPYLKWTDQNAYQMKEAAQDLGEILNDGAVLCGPPAVSLLYENELPGMIYAVGISDNDPDYFKKYPVTHFVIDPAVSGLIVQKYPELEKAVNTATFMIRDNELLVVRINHLTGNPEAAKYQPGDLEIGRNYVDRKMFDSALIFVEQFYRRYPHNKTAIKLMGDLLPINRRVGEGQQILEKGVEIYPDDYTLWMHLGVFYQNKYKLTMDADYGRKARECYFQVIRKNPYRGSDVIRLIESVSNL